MNVNIPKEHADFIIELEEIYDSANDATTFSPWGTIIGFGVGTAVALEFSFWKIFYVFWISYWQCRKFYKQEKKVQSEL